MSHPTQSSRAEDSTGESTRRSPVWGWVLGASLVLAVFLRFSGLGQESFWIDEIHSLRMAQAGGPVAIWNALRQDVHPPVYFWLLHYWLLVFPATEVGARALSALIGVGSVAAVYAWGRALRLPRLACATAAAFAAVSPHAIWYSQEVRMYGLETLLGTIHLALTARVLDAAGSRDGHTTVGRTERTGSLSRKRVHGIWGAPWLVVGILLLYTHFFGVFFLAGESSWAALVWIRIHHTRKAVSGKRLRSAQKFSGGWVLAGLFVAGIAILAVAALPLFLQMVARIRSGQGISWLSAVYALSWRTPSEVASALVCGPEIRVGPTWLRAGAVAGLLALVVGGLPSPAKIWRRGWLAGSELRRLVPTLIAGCLILLPLGVSLYRVIILGGQRYLTIAVPPLCLAAGVGVYRLLNRRNRYLAGIALASLLLIVGAQAAFLSGYYSGREKRMWREATAFVKANARSGDVVCAVPAYSLAVVEHYGAAPARPVSIGRMPTLSPAPRRVWVLSVIPTASLQERGLIDAGWRPTLNQSVHGKWASTLIRVTLFQREVKDGGQKPGGKGGKNG